MFSKELLVRVSHPTWGDGTVQEVNRRDVGGSFIHIVFDDDEEGTVRKFPTTDESFVAMIQEKVEEGH